MVELFFIQPLPPALKRREIHSERPSRSHLDKERIPCLPKPGRSGLCYSVTSLFTLPPPGECPPSCKTPDNVCNKIIHRADPAGNKEALKEFSNTAEDNRNEQSGKDRVHLWKKKSILLT